MAIEITYLGHSGFVIRDGKAAVAIDPFLTGNPVARHKPDEIKVGHIVLTHAHEDHFGDTLAIAKANRAAVYAVFELCNYINEQGHDRCEPGNPGGEIATDFGYVAFTHAFHSSSIGGRYMGQPCGVILNISGRTLYHCGDTGLFGDMKLIGDIYKPDAALIPIGDRFTMGPELASRAAELIGAPLAIPIHYNTWPPITVDLQRFAPRGVEVKAPAPGETFSL